jgi:phosphoglycerate dehydrogenase-like enzyme
VSSTDPAGVPSRPLVIQTEHLDEEPAAWLAERARLVKCPVDDERFETLLPAAKGLLVRTYTQVTDALLARAPNLAVVARAGVGLDNIDLAACKARGITVVSTPDANTRAVVEFVTALMLDALRPRLSLDRALDAKAWKSLRSDLTAAHQLADLTLGIYGLGRIGCQVARVGLALDMNVIYHDLLTPPPMPESLRAAPGFADRLKQVPRDTMLSRADVVTCHVDGRSENRRLLGHDVFGRMKPEVVFINTSRGFVVDNVALAEFMIAHPEAHALLDVHDPEPFDATYPLLDIANVHLSPHIAAATARAQLNMSWVVRELWDVLSRTTPPVR